MKVSIRPAVTADRPVIEAASRNTWKAHQARQPFAFAENGWDISLRREHEYAFWSAAGHPLGESGNLFVADAAGSVVGFILLSWHLRDDAPNAPDGVIIDIWVHPDWRKKGVGRNLVDFAKDMADAADWDNLKAQAWCGAPSETLFKDAGFSPLFMTWRYGPDRPATLPKPRKRAEKSTGTDWKWPVACVIIALLFVLATQL